MRYLISILFLFLASSAIAGDPVFKMPKLDTLAAAENPVVQGVQGVDLSTFARVGFSPQQGLETWSDPLEARVESLENKIEQLLEVKTKAQEPEPTSTKYRLERRLKYREQCFNDGRGCVLVPYYETVRVPIEDVQELGSNLSSEWIEYPTRSTPPTSSGRVLFRVESDGSVYRLARVRTWFRRFLSRRFMN